MFDAVLLGVSSESKLCMLHLPLSVLGKGHRSVTFNLMIHSSQNAAYGMHIVYIFTYSNDLLSRAFVTVGSRWTHTADLNE